MADNSLYKAWLDWWHDRYHDKADTTRVPGSASWVCARCYVEWEDGTGPHRNGAPDWFTTAWEAKRAANA